MHRRSVIIGGGASIFFESTRAYCRSSLTKLPEISIQKPLISERTLQNEVITVTCPNGVVINEPHVEPILGAGKFSGDPIVQLSSTEHYITLVHPLTFTQSNGLVWSVPEGVTSDGASIPKMFWSLVGGPLDGPYRNGAIIHDYYCDVRQRTWRDTHRVFYDSMLSNGVDTVDAKMMYYAVYGFGPRWDIQAICNTRRSLIRKTFKGGDPNVNYNVEPAPMVQLIWTDPVIETTIQSTPLTARSVSEPKARTDLRRIIDHSLDLDQIEKLADAN